MRHIIRTMENTLILRIKQRLEELGISPQRASREATGAKETLRKILDGTTKNPRIDTIQKIAKTLKATPEWLTGQTDDIGNHESATLATDVRQSHNADVPVLGTVAGSHKRGAFQLTPGAVDYVSRPPALSGTKDIYALYVEGDSMAPQYSPGTLVFVHPHKPADVGDAVIVQTQEAANEPAEATIAVLVRRTEKSVFIGKHNPPREREIDRETVISIHKVLTTNELFGV